MTFDRDWQEPVTAMVGAQALRLKMPDSTPSGEVVLYLSAGDAGDGREGDVVVWRRPRLEMPGRPALLLRDVRDLGRYLAARRRSTLDETRKYLAAAAEAPAGCDRAKIEALARSHGLPADALAAWLDYLGLAGEAPTRIEGYLTEKDTRGGGYEYVKAWRTGELPTLVANSSDMEVNIPGRVRPHGIVVHPSPERGGGDRLAEPDRRPGARRRDGRRRARRLRQRRRLVGGAAPRRPAPPARRPVPSATARRRRSRRSTAWTCRPAT